jgi:hypothetical protein
MENENLQKWALVAEIIGGIAVVLSLIFVGVGVRQSSEETAINTRAIQTNAYQDLISQINLLNLARIENPETLQIAGSFSADSNPDNEIETRYMSSVSAYVIRHGEMAHYQYLQGLIDKPRLDSALAILLAVLGTNHGRTRWENFCSLGIEYRNYVNELMAALEPDNVFWKSLAC